LQYASGKKQTLNQHWNLQKTPQVSNIKFCFWSIPTQPEELSTLRCLLNPGESAIAIVAVTVE